MSHILARTLLVLTLILAGCASSEDDDKVSQENTPGSVAMNYILGINFVDVDKIEFAFGKEMTDEAFRPSLGKLIADLNNNKFPAVVRRAGTDLANIRVESSEIFEDAIALVLIRYQPVSPFVLRNEDLRNALMRTHDREEAHQTAAAYVRNKHGSLESVRKEHLLIMSLLKINGHWRPGIHGIVTSYPINDRTVAKKKAADPTWDAREDKFMDDTIEDFNSINTGFMSPEIPWCTTLFCDGRLNLQSQAFNDRGKY